MPRIYFEDLELGRSFRTVRRTITEADIVLFAGLSGDYNPLHTDEIFAREETPFGRRIAHGLLGVSIGAGLASEMDDLFILAFLEIRRRFLAPIFPGDTICAEGTVAETRRSESRPDRGVVTMNMRLLNQDGVIVQSGEDRLLMGTRPQMEDR